jgi:hypothetical protein
VIGLQFKSYLYSQLVKKSGHYMLSPAIFSKFKISNKCFIHCPAEDKAEAIIF